MLELLLSERIVLLHSPSAAGKSSLIDAALRPQLEKEGFSVLPTMRLSCVSPVGPGAPNESNPYLQSLRSGLESGMHRAEPSKQGELAHGSLDDYLTEMEDRLYDISEPDFCTVLIFDQLEEVLRLEYRDEETLAVRKEFFREVGSALRKPHRFCLFAIREDFLGRLEPHQSAVPTFLENTYRLDLLTVNDAAEAIAKPAESAGVRFEPAALERLVDDLSSVTIETREGFKELKGLYVEPMQIQTVLGRLGVAAKNPETVFFQIIEGTGQVRHAARRQPLDGPGAGAGHRGAQRGGAPPGQDQALRAAGLGGAGNRTHVAGILQAVQRHEGAGRAPHARQGRQREGGERAGHQDHTLALDARREPPRQLLGRHAPHRDAERLGRAHHPLDFWPGAPVPHFEPPQRSSPGPQGLQDGMDAVDVLDLRGAPDRAHARRV